MIHFPKRTNCLFSTILKVQHIESRNKKYEFYDLNHDKVPLDYEQLTSIIKRAKDLIEGQKIFAIAGLKLIEELDEPQKLSPTQFSKIIPIDNNNKILYNIEEPIKIDNTLELISFEGKIVDFNLEENKIYIIDSHGKTINLKLNMRLFKKISIDSKCHFKCFSHEYNKVIRMNEFSDIISQDKTFLNFKFIDCDRYYDQILVDDIPIDISNEKQIKKPIEINNNAEKNILIKNIKLVNKKDAMKISYNIG